MRASLFVVAALWVVAGALVGKSIAAGSRWYEQVCWAVLGAVSGLLAVLMAQAVRDTRKDER